MSLVFQVLRPCLGPTVSVSRSTFNRLGFNHLSLPVSVAASNITRPLSITSKYELSSKQTQSALILNSCNQRYTNLVHVDNKTKFRQSFGSRHFSTSRTRFIETPKQSPEPSESPKKQSSNFIVSSLVRLIRLIVTAAATVAASLLSLLLVFFVYDYTTYAREFTEDTDKDLRINVPALALHPRTGGPKNLPMFEACLDDYDTNNASAVPQKPRLVVLGTGWGNISMLKNELASDDYEIIVISPTNYFLFTPLLPSATVGTLETRSLVEPIRNILRPLGAHYLLAKAETVLFDEQLVEVSAWDPAAQEERRFYVPYDRIVVGVGSVSNNHGVKGLEHCLKLKTVEDVALIRKKVVDNIEAACLPTTSDEERRRLLSFVVCGGGPTGVELAAELFDTVREDLMKRYPKIVHSEVSVHIIQSRSHILNTYDESISKYAESRFLRDGVDVVINSRVNEIHPDRVEFTEALADGTKVTREIPYGMCIWSTGVDKAPLTRAITESIGPEFQKNKRAIETDNHLRIIGAPPGTAYAIGDCATVRTNLVNDIDVLLREGVINNMKYTRYEDITGKVIDVTKSAAKTVIGDADPTFQEYDHPDDIRNLKLTYGDFQVLADAVQRREPRSTVHMARLEELFTLYDKNHDGVLSYTELCDLLCTIDRKVTSLPATAQRAAQQGKYLGRKLHRLVALSKTYRGKELSKTSQDMDTELDTSPKYKWGGLRSLFPGCPSHLDLDETVCRPFVYYHLGSLAYIGNGAVFDMNGRPYFGGILSMYLWRGAYFAQTVSFRTRCLMAMDWLKRGMFGRDLSGV